MATMMRSLSRYEHGSPPEDKIRELENRIQQLEEMVDRLIKSKNPSFMDFKFIKEDDRKEEERRENDRRVLAMARMFTR